jgi:tRNA G37 N-methylase Trm5
MMIGISNKRTFMDAKLKVLDLFSGIGGFSLGLERAGFETIAFCEIEPFCQSILRKHWQNVPIAENIKDLRYEKGILYDKDTPIYQGRIDLICGGFPCQLFSIAKKRTRRKKGTADNFMIFGVTSGQKCSELFPCQTCLDCVRKCCSLHAYGIRTYED